MSCLCSNQGLLSKHGHNCLKSPWMKALLRQIFFLFFSCPKCETRVYCKSVFQQHNQIAVQIASHKCQIKNVIWTMTDFLPSGFITWFFFSKMLMACQGNLASYRISKFCQLLTKHSFSDHFCSDIRGSDNTVDKYETILLIVQDNQRSWVAQLTSHSKGHSSDDGFSM